MKPPAKNREMELKGLAGGCGLDHPNQILPEIGIENSEACAPGVEESTMPAKKALGKGT